MSLKDKLEIGLKPDAPYRKDNLPETQEDDAACAQGAMPGTDEATEEARKACDENPEKDDEITTTFKKPARSDA